MPQDDRLTSDDWDVLKDMMAILKPLYALTNRMQGYSAILSDVIPSLNLMVEHFSGQLRAFAEPLLPRPLDDRQQRPRREPVLPRNLQGFEIHAQLPRPSPRSVAEPEPVENPVGDARRLHIRQSIHNALNKAIEYQSIIENIPIYWVGVILHPRYNLPYISSTYSDEVMRRALDAMRAIYTDYQRCHQRNLSAQRPQPAAPLRPQITNSEPEPDLFERFIQRRLAEPVVQEPVDELDTYLSMEQVRPDDVIAWWRGQVGTYPVLSRIALDVLSIPAMSDECERVFSQAKESVPNNRSSISPATLEALQCLKNWKKHGMA